MKNFLKTFLILLFLTSNALSGSDGKVELSKSTKKNESNKDCFEGINRATFAFNQGLDKIIFKPVALTYRKLPTPIKEGTSNVLDNLSLLTFEKSKFSDVANSLFSRINSGFFTGIGFMFSLNELDRLK